MDPGGLIPGGNGTSQTPPPRTSRVIKLILWAVLIIVAFPVFLGVGGGLLGLAAGILGILAAILVTLGATTFAVLLGGIVMLPYGVFHMFSHPLDGLMASGTGLILLGRRRPVPGPFRTVLRKVCSFRHTKYRQWA